MNIDTSAKYFSILSSLVALVALVWNVHVFRETTSHNQSVLEATVKQQQDSAAVELHNSYLSLAFENPEFAFEAQNEAELSPQKANRYVLFAIATIRVAERLHALTGNNPLWHRSIDEMLANHVRFVAVHFTCNDFEPEFGAYLKQRVENLHCE